MTRNLRFVNRIAVVLAAAAVPAVAGAQVTVGRVVARDYATEIACSAQATTLPPENAVRIGEGRERGKSLFGPGDPIIVRGGTSQGVKAGQDYFVRRVVGDRSARPGSDAPNAYSIHTARSIH